MSGPTAVDRRRFLGVLVAAAGALAAGPALVRRGSRPVVPAPAPAGAAARLAALLAPGSGRAGARVGRAYLATAPAERDADTLARRLADSLGADAATIVALDGATVRRRLAARIQRDFGEARTVEVDGWILSVTEARLCALAALARSA